ncbi:hypothetical protein ACFPM0_35435 [Pseudonocardia sulfidoxydans]|uniref:hypothetical protein n=1 Tax=Pseudonocardia sulfidoxydans TaxID=54011 RepID=UPI003617543D
MTPMAGPGRTSCKPPRGSRASGESRGPISRRRLVRAPCSVTTQVLQSSSRLQDGR